MKLPLLAVGISLSWFCPSLLQGQRIHPPLDSMPAKTLLLQLEGDANSLHIKRAWKKNLAFSWHLKENQKSQGTILLRDGMGKVLTRLPVDLSPFNLFQDQRKGKILVSGDRILAPHISLLVKIPDLGNQIKHLELLLVKTGGRQRTLLNASRKDLDLAFHSAPTPLTTPVVKTHFNNGPSSNRYDIVVLADGYRSSERTKFYNDISRWTTDFFSREPFKTYKKFFNIHSVFRASVESGADHPENNPPITRNTAYDATYNSGGVVRCITIKNTSLATSDAALAPDVDGRVLVFVNDPKYGGCASTFAVSYNGSSAPKVQTHEFGHSFGKLADEYGGHTSTYTGSEPTEPNVTKDKTGKAKWPLWLGFNGISAFEGARYYNKGLYRPKSNCLMRSLSAPLCEVCIEQELKQGYLTVNPIENPIPTASSVSLNKPQTQTFRFNNLVPASVSIRWLVDGSLKQSGGTSFSFNSSSYSTGKHTLRLEVRDKTPMVRKDPNGILSHSRSWTVNISGTALPDLWAQSFSAPSAVTSGTRVTLRATIKNRKPVGTRSFANEFFLSFDNKITTNDLFLGSVWISLGANGSKTISKKVLVPSQVDKSSQPAYFAVWIDRTNRIKESNEGNNKRLFRTTRKGPSGCSRHLEYRGSFQYNYFWQAFPRNRKGSRNMVLTAPCNKGHWALILWSCKGTSPGLNLPGGHHLPLNYDPLCTTLGLSILRGTAFHGFMAKINAQGHSFPKISDPRSIIGLNPRYSYFAGILFNSNFSAITGATNAVTLYLRS